MTIEIQKYTCPSCGHPLGEAEYKTVCEKNDKLLSQLAEEELQSVKLQHAIEMQELQQKHNLEKEKEVGIKVHELINQEKREIESKQKLELAEKDKIIELVKMQGAEQLDEKIKWAVNQNETKHLQYEKEYQLKLKRLEAQIEKQQKTIEGIPPELRGTAGEFVLLELLQKQFPRDKFTAKKPGISMADVIQTIVTEIGDTIPTPIVYDVKMGDKVTKSDIAKAKNYMSIHNTTHSIIVTKDIKNERYSELREGVLLVHPLAIVDIAEQIRKFSIETRIVIKNNTGRDTRQSKLYDYFTSQEYTRYKGERMELKLNLDNLDRKEEVIRNKRNGLIEKWFGLDNKNDGIIMGITQDDIDIQNQTESINVGTKDPCEASSIQISEMM